jgi:aspartyl-tRNA(Asn)/glutamyl-tRNA(Gln) amidotransferase subunit B
MSQLIPIIGLEIHVELRTKSKMFCSCANDPFIDTPNVHICEVCLAHPGTLPVPNEAGIAGAIKIAKALNCTIAKDSKFDRKHYFYPDLPKGYQISQYDQPIGEHGYIDLELTNSNHRSTARIGVTRVHLEEDTAKLTHGVGNTTLVDFNRAGVPLVEIVSDPDVQSAQEAKAYCQELQLIFRTLGVSTADMEKGQMRCEANISIQTAGSFTNRNGIISPVDGARLNAKVEVKNINSFKAVEKAIEFEIKRQSALIEKGETWSPETRGWDENKQETVHQRSKESAADYRYFPEPDIPPFNPSKLAETVALPELPQVKRARFTQEFGFSRADAQILTSDLSWAEFSEQVMSELYEWLHSLPESKDLTEEMTTTKRRELAKLTGGWITSKLMGALSERKIDIRILKVKPENFAELIALIYTNRINSTNAQKILIEMLDSGVDRDPTHIMEEKGYGQISDEGKLGAVVDDIIKNYPEQVAQFKSGKEPIIKFLVGMLMKATEGSADPHVAERLLREKMH